MPATSAAVRVSPQGRSLRLDALESTDRRVAGAAASGSVVVSGTGQPDTFEFASARAPQAALAAVNGRIAEVERGIVALEGEIRALEGENAARRAQADQLVNDLERKRRELQDAKNQRNFLLALFGAPPMALLVNELLSDPDYRRLSDSLERARADLAEIDRRLAANRAGKQVLGKELARLQEGAAELARLSAAAPVAARPTVAKLETALGEYELRVALQRNLEGQAQILSRIRDAAGRVGLDLEQLVGSLTQELRAAEERVARSRKLTLELLQRAAGGADGEGLADVLVGKARTKVEATLRSRLEERLGKPGSEAERRLYADLAKRLTAVLTPSPRQGGADPSAAPEAG
jgi:hypothetical protein